MYSVFECVRALKIKSQQCSMTEIKKRSEWPNHRRSTAHARNSMETSFYMMYFYIFTHNFSQDDELFSGN